MLECDKIDISEVIDINKTNASKECDIFHYDIPQCDFYHYWYFLNKNVRILPYLPNGFEAKYYEF